MTLRFPKPLRRGRKPRRPIRRSRQPKALSDYGIRRDLADSLSSVACRAEHALGIAHPRAGLAQSVGCEVCGCGEGVPQGLQWAHGITRSRPAIRYHPDNTIALCAACHMSYTYHLAHLWPMVHAGIVGPRSYELLLVANTGKRHTVDLELVTLDAERRIVALPYGTVREWALERRDAARAVYNRRIQ